MATTRSRPVLPLFASAALGLACSTAPAAAQAVQPRAPVAPAVPQAGPAGASSIQEAYALEKAGNFDEAIVAYLKALLPEPPEMVSLEAPVAVARLSDDRGQLEQALLATELLPAGVGMGLSIPQAVLTAKLGRHDRLPEALVAALAEMSIVGGMAPDGFTLMLEALLALSGRSPEQAAAALVSFFELTSPHPDVWRRGLDRIERALAGAPGEPALGAMAMLVADATDAEARAQELEDALRQAALPAGPETGFVEWALEGRDWGRQLDAELATLKRQGLPLSMKDVAPKPVPDAENAAVLYQKVFQVQFNPQGDGAGEPVQVGPSLSEIDGALDPGGGVQPGAPAWEVLRGPRAQEVLETLRQASLRPQCVFPLKWEDGFAMLMPHLAKFREAARVTAAYSRLLAHEGRIDEALDWCMVALRMSEHAASEPSLIAQLVGLAMQGITLNALREIVSGADVSPALAQRFDECLRGMEPCAGLDGALVAERAAVCGVYDTLRRSPGDVVELLGDGAGPEGGLQRLYCSPVARSLHQADQLAYLAYMQSVRDLIRLPYRETREQFAGLWDQLAQGPSPVLAVVLAPSYDRIAQRRDSAMAEIGLCRVALALKVYRHEHGAYPPSLAALQQAVTSPLPPDPFTGGEFVYERVGDGFRLHSLGPDLDDDRGATQNAEGHDADNCDIAWECVR